MYNLFVKINANIFPPHNQQNTLHTVHSADYWPILLICQRNRKWRKYCGNIYTTSIFLVSSTRGKSFKIYCTSLNYHHKLCKITSICGGQWGLCALHRNTTVQCRTSATPKDDIGPDPFAQPIGFVILIIYLYRKDFTREVYYGDEAVSQFTTLVS